jgi:hypothetical protein
MNKVRPSFLLYLICMGCSRNSQAQKVFPHDTAYYQTFPDKFTVGLYLSKNYVHLNFPSGGPSGDLEYKANPKLNLGAGITLNNFSINLFNGFGFLNPKDDPKGKTKGFDFQIHIYPRGWAIDLLFLSPKGYHLDQKGTAGVATDEYYYRSDLETTLFGISAYRVPNKERFSYRAALAQSEWQKKSAGSFLYGGEIHPGVIQGDSSLIPALLSHTYPQAGIKKINILGFGPGGGYAYTFVVQQHFFITGSLIFNLDATFTKEVEEGIGTLKTISFNPSEVFKVAAGYNGEVWNVSADWAGAGFWAKGATVEKDYFFPTGNIRLVIAHRFPTHRRRT